MITEKGILPVGVELDGQVHREFEIRPAMVKDSVEAGDEYVEAKLANGYFTAAVLTAKQIVRIGEISPVPVDVVTAMCDVDMAAIASAKARLKERLLTLRSQGDKGNSSDKLPEGPESTAQGTPGAAKDSASPGDSA